VPINRESLGGERPLRAVILSVLRTDPNAAFSVAELVIEVGFLGLQADFVSVEAALATLQQRGLLITDEIDGTLYFSYDYRFGFRPSR